MSAPLEYATPTTPKTRPPGLGYYLLVVVNIVAFVMTAILFFIEISASRAAILGLVAGPPLFVGQLVLATLPSWAYVGVRGAEMSKEAKVTLIGISAVTPLLGILGMILFWVGG